MEYPFKDLLPLDEVLAREGYYKDWTHLDPEVFYSLTQISEYIKTKGYGVDVRLLIAQLAEHFGLRVTQITDAMNEFIELKPKAELAISKSAEALTKSQNALNVANGIDAKATNALSLSESADALSKSVQDQFNQVVIEGDSSVEAAQARVDAKGVTKPTLKQRLDDDYNEVATQLAQTIDSVGVMPEKNINPNTVWKEMQVREVNVDWFGADPSGVLDSTEAFQKALSQFPDDGFIRVVALGAKYKITKPLYITRRVLFEGNGIDRTTLSFKDATEVSNPPYNAFITVVHSGNTIGGQHGSDNPIILPEGQVGKYGQHALLRDFTIEGSKTATTEQNGLFINAPSSFERVRVVNANGWGFILAGNGEKDGKFIKGNANHTKLDQCYAYGNNKDGLHIWGADANTFDIRQFLAYVNGGWGISDDSFLGGVIAGCEADGNHLGAYRSAKDTGSRTVWLGNYVEGNQPIFYDVSPKHIILGANGMPPEEGQPYIGGLTVQGGALTTRTPIRIADTDQQAFDMGGTTGNALEIAKDKIRLRTKISEPLLTIEQDGISGNYAAIRMDNVTSIAIAYKDLTNAIKKGTPLFRQGVAYNQNVNYTLGSGPPSTGTWTGGQRIINQSPQAGSYEGWVCVNGGSPGTWKGYGLIQS